MKQGKFQIALVGCGGMAALYRHRYTEIPGAELALLIDASPETAQNASAALGGFRGAPPSPTACRRILTWWISAHPTFCTPSRESRR